MAALHSLPALSPLSPEDRVEIERDLAKARGDAESLRFRLAELKAANAPRSFRGTIQYQLSVQERWIEKYERWLVAA